MTKQKVSTKIALAILLIAALLLACSLCFFTPITGAETDSAANTATSSVEGDYSEYTDKELPDTINADNILQIVPAELFNNGGPYIYCGSKYGFVIYSEGQTNYILLFIVEAFLDDSTDTYRNRLSVYYEGAFVYNENVGIIGVNADKHLMLSDISFNETIIDSAYNNVVSPYYNKNTNDGAIFISARQGDTQVTYYDTDSLKELIGSYGRSIVVSGVEIVADLLFPDFGDAAGEIAGAVADMVWNIVDLVKVANSIWEKDVAKDSVMDFPSTAQKQLESEETGHNLIKSLSFENVDGVANVLSYVGSSGTSKGDYVEFITRTSNPNNIPFYMSTNFGFNIGLYSNFGCGSELGNYTVSGALSVKNGTTEYVAMTGNEKDGFDLNETAFFAPMLKGSSFTFTPDITGEYTFGAPSGYGCQLQDSSGNQVTSTNGRYTLTAGQTYKVGICKQGKSVEWNKINVDDYYLEGEFIDGEAAFASVQVKRVQDLPFIDDGIATGTIPTGISFAYSDDYSNNDLFKITATDISQLSVYLADSDMNILAKGNVGTDGIYINYPLNEGYYLICKNDGAQTDITIEDTGALVLGESQYTFATGEGLYYKAELEHTQYYNVSGVCQGVYSAEGVKQNDNNGTYWLPQDDYYLLSNDATQLSIYYDSASMAEISAPDTEYTYSDNNADAIFRLFCNYTMPVQLSVPCDVYCNKELIAENATRVLLEGGEVTNIYDFVVTDGSKSFSFTPDATNIGYNAVITANSAEAFTAYKFTLNEAARIFADSQQDLVYSIYDTALNRIEEDHGYLLEEGNYYIVVENSGNYSFEVKEKLIPVDITFIVDGAEIEAPSGQIYYYGKMAELPVPEKDHYDFAGWQLPDGTMLTDSLGATLQPVYFDEVTLTAQWVVRKVELQVNMAEGSALWWTGSEFSETKVTIDFQTALFNDLVNLYNAYVSLPEGNKPGHYFTQFTTTYISSEGNVDTYEFAPVWQVESYHIQFVFANGDILSYNDIDYGTEISDSLFAESVLNPTKRGYSFENWRYEENVCYNMAEGDRVPDFTPDIGVIDTIAVTLVAQFTPVEYTITINGQQIKVTCEDSYKIKTLAEYGISASAYNGKNIYYTRSDNNATYYEGNAVEDVYSDITLSLKEQYATANITYADCEGANNPVSIDLGKTHVLQPATKNTYEFDHWEYNGGTITSLSISSLGIAGYLSNANPHFDRTVKAIWKSGYVSVGVGIHTLSYASGNSSKLHVDCTTKSIARTVTFRIASDVNEVTFHDNNRSWGDFAIFVENRNTELTINFDGLSGITGYANDGVINARFCPSLILNAMTDINIRAGEINSLTDNFEKAAIICNNLTLKGKNFSIYGGEYILDFMGTERVTIASRGISEYSKSTMTISANSVTVNGGDGVNGLNCGNTTASTGSQYSGKGNKGLPGGAGTNGACAIYWTGTINISAGSTVVATGGNGGDGGDGGNGGKGGPGRNGSFGVTTKEPGDGGDGGDGGHGGNGALAIQGSPTINGSITKSDGEGGKGGDAGEVGVPGDPVETMFGSEKRGSYGNPGQNGNKGATGVNDGL